MDVAAFSGDNFDPKDWINKALRSSDPAQSKVWGLGNPWHNCLTFAGRNARSQGLIHVWGFHSG